MKYFFCLLLLVGSFNLYSKEFRCDNQILASDSLQNGDTTFFVRIKVVNKHLIPIESAVISLGLIENYWKTKYLGESKKNGEFSIRLSKKINYDCIKISYTGYKDYIISLKNKTSINFLIIKMIIPVFLY